MTLIDVKNAVLDYFMANTLFDLTEDMASLNLGEGKDTDEGLVKHRLAIVKTALDDFARGGIVAEVSAGVYLLVQPLNTLTQQVTITPFAACMVADLVNEFEGEGPDGHQYQANKLGLTSYDIESVCRLCHFLLDEESRPSSS